MPFINPEDQIINLSSVAAMSESERSKMLSTFNRSGFVILACEHSPHAIENLLRLSKFFGSVIHHNQSDANGIFPITLMPNCEAYANTTNNLLALHTDGSFEATPPQVMAMQCEVAAVEGGLTCLAEAQAVYDYLYETEQDNLPVLFQPDVFTIRRANQVATRAIFEERNGRIGMAFRSDDAAQISIASQASHLFHRIKDFLANPQNQIQFKLQPDQILIFDNTRILHGRTGFKHGELRKIHGLWLDGDSSYTSALKFGFAVSSDRYRRLPVGCS